MRIGFDARYIQDRYHGIGRYAFELLRHQLARQSDDRYVVVWNPTLKNTRFDLAGLLAHDRVLAAPTHVPLLSPWDQVWLPHLARRSRLDLFHVPYFAVPLCLPCPLVITVHDLIFERYPQFMPHRWARHYYGTMMRLGLRRARGVATVSQATRRDLLRFYPVEAEKIVVTLESVGAPYRPVAIAQVAAIREKYRLPECYILCVGVRRPHKNIGAVLAALGRIGAGVPHHLVLVGGADARFPDDIPASIAANGLAGRVRELGEVPESELPALYTGAAAYLCPSWIEGFGLPVLEAFACGTPVIVGDCPALREVAGDAALSFDPANVDALAWALRRILTEPSLAHDLAERGRIRVGAFSWSRLADQTRALYAAASAEHR